MASKLPNGERMEALMRELLAEEVAGIFLMAVDTFAPRTNAPFRGAKGDYAAVRA